MNLNKFTEKAQEAILGARQLAESLSHAQIEPEHLLVALAEQTDGVVPAVLRKLNLDPADIARSMRAEISKGPQAYGGARAGHLAAPEARDRPRAGGGREAQGRVRQHGAPVCRHRRRDGPLPRRTAAHLPRPHARQDLRGAHVGAREPARDRPEPRRQVPGARTLRQGPHRARRARHARIRSSAETTRFGASFRCCRAAPRTTRS